MIELETSKCNGMKETCKDRINYMIAIFIVLFLANLFLNVHMNIETQTDMQKIQKEQMDIKIQQADIQNQIMNHGGVIDDVSEKYNDVIMRIENLEWSTQQ